ncbi:hypothetical protein BH11PLA1_BH11PLA1_11990 [soil metagenome]
MMQISKVLRRAAMRLFVGRVLSAAVLLLTGAIGAMLVMRVLEQGALRQPEWWRAAAWGGYGVVIGSLVWAAATRPGRLKVARAVDEGAGLKETLSTACALDGAKDAWSLAVIENAQSVATTVRVSRAVPIAAPARWPAPFIAALVLLVTWVALPKMDWMGERAKADEAQRDEKKLAQTKKEADTAKAKVQQLLAKVDPKLAEKPDEAKTPEEKKALEKSTPEDIKRAAIKSLTDMKDRLTTAKSGEKMQTAEQMMDKLKQLRTPGSGPLTEMASALSQGKISEAKGELEKLAKEMGEGKLSAGDKAKLGEQLNKMAQQLDRLSKDKAAMEQALEKAGLDKVLAEDAQKLAEALQSNQALNPEQKQALQNMQAAMKQANQACANMSAAMKEAAGEKAEGGQKAESGQQAQKNGAGEKGEKGESGQPGQGMSQEMAQGMEAMQEQLGAMEMAQQDMGSMEAAMAEAQQQLQAMGESMGQCDSPGMGACKGGLNGNGDQDGNGEQNSPGSDGFGRGGPGISQGGGNIGEKTAAEKWEKIKVKSQDAGGPTIGTMLIQGEQVKGESTQAFTAITTAAEQEATEALENNVIERQYHDLVKHYFGELAAKAKSDAEKKVGGPMKTVNAKQGSAAPDAPTAPKK